jgi:hypothetical protein
MQPVDTNRISPEENGQFSQQLSGTKKQIRSSHYKGAFVFGLMIAGIVLMALHSGHSPLLQSLLVVMLFVAAIVFFLRNATYRSDPGFVTVAKVLMDAAKNSNSLQNDATLSSTGDMNRQLASQYLNIDTQIAESASAASAIPGGALIAKAVGVHGIKDPSELPPELAASPDVRKLFEWSKSRGMVWTTNLEQGQKIVGPMHASIRIVTKAGGHTNVRTLSSLDELPPELAANPDIKKLIESLREWARGSNSKRENELSANPEYGVSEEGTTIIKPIAGIRSSTFLILLCAILAFGLAVLWSLWGAPSAK